MAVFGRQLFRTGRTASTPHSSEAAGRRLPHWPSKKVSVHPCDAGTSPRTPGSVDDRLQSIRTASGKRRFHSGRKTISARHVGGLYPESDRARQPNAEARRAGAQRQTQSEIACGIIEASSRNAQLCWKQSKPPARRRSSFIRTSSSRRAGRGDRSHRAGSGSCARLSRCRWPTGVDRPR